MIEVILVLLAVTVGILAAVVFRMYALVLAVHERSTQQHAALLYLLSDDDDEDEEPAPSLDEPSTYHVTLYLN